MKKLFTLLSLLCALNSFAQVTIYSENMGTGSASSVTAYTGWQNVAPIVYSSSTTPAQSDVRTTAVSSGYTGASGGSNIFMSTTSGNARDFVISGINTSSYSNVQLSFGLNTPSITAFMIVEYSTDGTTFTAVPFTNPTATGWSLVSGIALPASATLTVKFSKNNGSQFRLDDVSITGIGAGIPGLTAGPAVTGLTAVTGSASPAISYNLAGTSLTGFPGNISVTPSANLEVSLSSGTGFTAGTLPVPYTTATLASTPIYVRIAAGAPAGALTGATVSNAGGGATTVNVNVSGNVVSAEPTVQTSGIVISAVTDNGLTINWANGNGEARIISYRQTATPAVAPVDGSSYTTTLGGGNTIAYIGAATGPVTITGLVAGTGYTIQGYEYNGTTAGSTNYLTTTAVNNPVTTTTTGVSPNIQQGFFTSVSTPVYGARSATRVPTVAIGTISGLAPNTTYRYYSTAAATTDFGTATSAGTLILNDYTNPTPSFYTASTGNLAAAGSFGKFTSDASGKFTGTFGYFASSNGRFDAGNQVYVTVTIGEDVAPFATKYRFALDQAITMLNWGITPTDGSFIKGASSASANNVVALWKSIDGNLVAARPLAMTLVEDNATTTAPVAPYDETAGSWNTIIPNDNPEGIRLIQQFTPTGVVVGCNSDADGTWPSGASTSDPVNGSVVADAIQLTITDAPINAGACFGVLPVSLINFSAQKANRAVVLKWSTSQEQNTRSFVIERSTDNRTWNTIATVAAAGNSSSTRNYTYTDNVPAKGINYYRLKQVDMDYRAVTSAVRPVLFSEQYSISVAPNPATDFINVYIAKNDQKTTQIIVADINGKVIEKIVTADQLLSISTSRYAKGVYFVKVITDEQTTTQKVIVQ